MSVPDGCTAYFGATTDQIEVVLNAGMPANPTCVTLTLSGLANMSGVALGGDTDIHYRILTGDANGDGIVNILDLSEVKAELFQPVTDSNCRCDIDISNVINILDLSEVKSRLFTTKTCP